MPHCLEMYTVTKAAIGAVSPGSDKPNDSGLRISELLQYLVESKQFRIHGIGYLQSRVWHAPGFEYMAKASQRRARARPDPLPTMARRPALARYFSSDPDIYDSKIPKGILLPKY